MRSTLCNSIFGDDDDLIRTFDRGKTMSDGDRCAVFGKFFQAFLDLSFTLIIQCTGSFIQDQDRRVFQEDTGNGNPLLLTTGETGTTFSDKGFILLWKFHDKVVDVCTFCSGNDLFVRGIRFSVGNIITDRS